LWLEANTMNSKIIARDPEILGGTPVFAGTRVPIKAIFDYLEAGDDLDEFLDDFPSVSRDQAIGILAVARENLIDDNEAAA